MRVQFIWFNINATPKVNLGIALLVQELRQAGHQADVLHLNEDIGMGFDTDRIVARVAGYSPGMIALSFGRNHLRYVEQLLPALRKGLPQVPILCGGVHATLAPEQVFSWPEVDFIFIGEADGLLAPFVTSLENNEDVSGHPGYWGKQDDRTWHNAMPLPPDIGDQTRMAFEEIDHLASLRFNRGMFEVVSGRGCPGRCSFCFNQSMRDAYRARLTQDDRGALRYCRKRSVDNLLDEMSEVLARFGEDVKMFSFADDAFNFDRSWSLEFFREYARRIDRPYTCNLLVAQIDDEIARGLKRSGGIAKIGVESGVERIRCDLLDKGFDNATLKRGLARLRAHGVPTRIYLMVGIPTETRDDVLETFRFSAGLRADSTRLCMFFPIEGTPIHDTCRRMGLLTDREYENYDDLSILRWEDGMALFLEKVHDIHPWLHNRHLGPDCSAAYGPLIDRALAMGANEWARPETHLWIRDESVRLSRYLRDQDTAHYLNPFPERPDVAFLYSNVSAQLPNADLIDEPTTDEPGPDST